MTLASVLASCALSAFFLMVNGLAHAEAVRAVNPGPHRLSLGAAAELTAPGINADANWTDFAFAIGVSAGYAYRVLPWLETGAQAAFWETSDRAPNIFMPALSLRVFTPLTNSARNELGLTARAGLLGEYIDVPNYKKTWHGSAFTAAGDVRTWLSPKVACQLSLELTSGRAHSERGDFYSQQNTTYTALGLWARLILAP